MTNIATGAATDMTAASGGTLMSVLIAAQDAKITPLLWGEPGVGKTSLVRALAQSTGREFFNVVGSLREPTDFAGLPIVRGDSLELAAPSWALAANDAEGGAIVFLDEVTTCSPSTQAAMLGTALERTVGELQLNNDVAVIAAANPPSMAAGGYDLTAPMANRFLHITYAPTAEEWIEGMLNGWPSPTPGIVHPATTSRVSSATALVTSFLRVSPDMAQCYPTDEAVGHSWPSHRTWSMVTAMLARLDWQDTDAVRVAVAGLVGERAATEFLAHMGRMELPDPAEVLDDPTCVDWQQMRPDVLWRALDAVAKLTSTLATGEAWKAAWCVLAYVAQNTADDSPAAAHAMNLAKIKPTGTMTPPREARAFMQTLIDSGRMEVVK